jgi:hypothetical protein
MIRAYHFLPDDMRADEDIVAGIDEPWRIGDTRKYKPVKIAAGEGEFITESGYHSSKTLWDALMQANVPVACLVEISEPLLSDGSAEFASSRISEVRKSIAAVDVRSELRRFACDCAERPSSRFTKVATRTTTACAERSTSLAVSHGTTRRRMSYRQRSFSLATPPK